MHTNSTTFTERLQRSTCLSEICGRISLFTIRDILNRLRRHNPMRPLFIANINLHALYISLRDPEFATILCNADDITYDGFGARLVGMALGGEAAARARSAHHLPYQLWGETALALACERRWRVAFISGRSPLETALRKKLQVRFPTLVWRHWDGYAAAAEPDTILEDIAAWNADLAFVGMGMPRQERFIARATARIGQGIWLPCGGWLDFYSGLRRDVPKWAFPMGIAWLLRLVNEPKHVWRRYTIEVACVATAAIRQRLTKR